MTEIEMPAAVRAYLTAHAAKDDEAAVRAFAPDAAVTDEGRTFRGTREISAWRQRASTEWTYTTTVTGARRDGDDWIVGIHLEGDFPGGVADLEQRFTVRDGAIGRLVIA
ncbi:nuclear transport factor 2 family protein [Actinoplanes sp. NPDC051411]|uniref:nuclear transport factor 2 family protein n=1 Tax=Actinoplanes sp. NPDC051411 TaxID=3155522 RepID=UPI0034159D9C